jgi:hypothetical protein
MFAGKSGQLPGTATGHGQGTGPLTPWDGGRSPGRSGEQAPVEDNSLGGVLTMSRAVKVATNSRRRRKPSSSKAVRKLPARVPEPTTLALLDQAERALVMARDAVEVQRIIDAAEAVRAYARQARQGTAMVNHATEIKVLAELKLVEVVQQGRDAGRIATQGTNLKNTPPGPGGEKPATLDDLGVNQQRLSEAKYLGHFKPSELRTRFAEATEQDVLLPRGQLLTEARHRARRVDMRRVNGNGYEVTVGPVTPDEADDMVDAAGLASIIPDREFKGDYQPQPETADRGTKRPRPVQGMHQVVLSLTVSEWKEWRERIDEHMKQMALKSSGEAALDLIRRGSLPTYNVVQDRFREWLSTGKEELEPGREGLAWLAFAAGARFPLAGPDGAGSR